MVKSALNKPSGGTTLPKAKSPSDEELLERLLASEWRDDLLDDLGDREEVMRRLFDVALASLKRTNAMASRMVKDSAASRRDFDAWLTKLKQSQSETRTMIEELVSGQ